MTNTPNTTREAWITLKPDSMTRLFKGDDVWTYTHPDGSQATFESGHELRVHFFDTDEQGPQMLLTQAGSETQVALAQLPENIPMLTVNAAADFLEPVHRNSLQRAPTSVCIATAGEKPAVMVSGSKIAAAPYALRGKPLGPSATPAPTKSRTRSLGSPTRLSRPGRGIS